MPQPSQNFYSNSNEKTITYLFNPKNKFNDPWIRDLPAAQWSKYPCNFSEEGMQAMNLLVKDDNFGYKMKSILMRSLEFKLLVSTKESNVPLRCLVLHDSDTKGSYIPFDKLFEQLTSDGTYTNGDFSSPVSKLFASRLVVLHDSMCIVSNNNLIQENVDCKKTFTTFAGNLTNGHPTIANIQSGSLLVAFFAPHECEVELSGNFHLHYVNV